MRPTKLAIAAIACLLSCGIACADTKITERVRTYDVAGATGAELIEAMDGLGPRHGHATRAIAETGYTVHWKLDLTRDDGICRLRQATGTMDVTYTFPRRLSPAGAVLNRRWDRFMAGVRQHEHTHGRIAKQMMRKTDAALGGLKRPDNWFCTNLHKEARRRIDTIYAEYEARQNAFDAREHRPGGHVDRLVHALIGKN